MLLDDARVHGAAAARLFVDPVDTLVAQSAADLPALLSGLEAAAARGLHAAGYLAYEAGRGLAPAWRGPAGDGDAVATRRSAGSGCSAPCGGSTPIRMPALLPDPASAWVGAVTPRVARADYLAAVEAVLDYIRAGDIYQANLTFRADVPVLGDPLAIYARLRRTARAGYGGFIWTGEQAIASLSPELFFALCAGARWWRAR